VVDRANPLSYSLWRCGIHFDDFGDSVFQINLHAAGISLM
jgi:hypothetical protein